MKINTISNQDIDTLIYLFSAYKNNSSQYFNKNEIKQIKTIFNLEINTQIYKTFTEIINNDTSYIKLLQNLINEKYTLEGSLLQYKNTLVEHRINSNMDSFNFNSVDIKEIFDSNRILENYQKLFNLKVENVNIILVKNIFRRVTGFTNRYLKNTIVILVPTDKDFTEYKEEFYKVFFHELAHIFISNSSEFQNEFKKYFLANIKITKPAEYREKVEEFLTQVFIAKNSGLFFEDLNINSNFIPTTPTHFILNYMRNLIRNEYLVKGKFLDVKFILEYLRKVTEVLNIR